MKTKYVFIPFALGLGLALVWVLGGRGRAAVAAPVLSADGTSVVEGSRTEGHIEVPSAPAAELHVCPGGCAYSSIQDAVDAADDGDVIKVATGVYTGVQGRPAPAGYVGYDGPSVITQVIYISKTVTIRGGYTTANGFADPPNPDTNLTTLDAQRKGRVLFITGNISPQVEGLRITGGDAAGLGGSNMWGFTFDAGGGVYVITATATISNSRVFSNTTLLGGGLCLYSSVATLSNNTVISNTAGYGGGLCLHSSPATLSGNTISSNTASYGGGLFLQSSAATLSNNTVISNTAGKGGGLLLWDSPAMLSGNTVSGNTADEGGGVGLGDSAATLISNTVISNTADEGGGLRLSGSDAVLGGNTVSGNTAGSGGGVALGDSAATLSNNTVISNTADEGGGLRLSGSDAILTNNVVADNRVNTAGSGLYIVDSSPRLLHNTIARNRGGDGSGIHIADYPWGTSTVTLTNTILVSHTVGITITAGNTTTLAGTLWGSGSWANTTDWGGNGTVITGTQVYNHWGDPAFVAPDAGDYHIGPASAAIDRGVDAGVYDDIDGDPRPFDGDGDGVDEFDIGADEAHPALVVAKQATPDPVQPGGQLTYTIRVTNTGAVDLHATITDTLPTYVTTTQPLVWVSQPIPASGGIWTETVVVTVAMGYTGLLTNVVEVTTVEGATGIYTETSAVEAGFEYIYLPLVMRSFP